MLGDLKDDAGSAHGNGDAALSLYPESTTPNLHALARSYALADNFYAADARLERRQAVRDRVARRRSISSSIDARRRRRARRCKTMATIPRTTAARDTSSTRWRAPD